MSNLLTVQNLVIALKETGEQIVRDISFTMKKGCALALVGESGSGKTLTCKAIMRLLNNNLFTASGIIEFDNANLLTLPEKDVRAMCGKRVSMIVQNPMSSFDPTQKIGAAMVETLLAHHKIPRIEAVRLCRTAFEKMELPHPETLLNSYPHTLSGGMLQRVVIALAMMQGPEIIIADEPTTALDVVNATVVLAEIARIKLSGVGVLLVTHDFSEAAKIAENVIVMKDGKIVEEGSVRAVFEKPHNSYTRELLEARQLNYA